MTDQQIARFPYPSTAARPKAPPGLDLPALMRAGQALICGWQAVQGEMLAFWQSRLKESLATNAQLLECRSPDAALEIQLEYAKAAAQAYLDHSIRVTGLVMQALEEGLMPPPAPQPAHEETGALAA